MKVGALSSGLMLKLKFMKIGPWIQKLKGGHTHTHTHTQSM